MTSLHHKKSGHSALSMIVAPGAALAAALAIASPAVAAGNGQGNNQGSGQSNTQSTSQASNSSSRSKEVTIGGQQMSAKQITGKAVTSEGERIGKIVGVIHDPHVGEQVVIKLNAKHSEMGVVAGENKTSGQKQNPTVVGGRTIAISPDELQTQGGKSGAFKIAANKLTTAQDVHYDKGQGAWIVTEPSAGAQSRARNR